jgi:polyphosphate kinase
MWRAKSLQSLRQGAGYWAGSFNRNTFVSMEQIIINNLDLLFGGMEIKSAHMFRTTRNADVARNEEEAEDLLEMITDEVRDVL